MAAAPHAPPWEVIDPFIEAYEKALAGHAGPVDLGDFLPPPEHAHYLAVLRELVRADLEHRWGGGGRRSVEDYLAAFPALREDASGLREIAFEEYRLRRQGGESPSPEEYRRRLGVDPGGWPAGEAKSPEPASAVESAALAYLGRRPAGHVAPPASESAELLASLHRDDPEAGYRLAQALTSLPSPGQRFLGFELLKELGRGAFGRVYLAREKALAGRLVALKVGADLQGESQFLARLQHTNIVPVYSVHRANPFQALCMPYFGATTLAQVLRELKQLPAPPRSGRWLVQSLATRQDATNGSAANRATDGLTLLGQKSYPDAVLWLGTRLAEGLAYAHERGVLHQDIKPANVLLADDGQPMLLDFSLSQDTKLGASLPAAYVGGTLPYMAPEHLEAFRDGRRHADPRSDVYSLGLILAELLTGRPAFPLPAGSLSEKLRQMIADREAGPPDVRRLNRAVSPAAASIVRHCLRPDPARRYQSARQLHEDLERHLNNLPLRWAREPSLMERGRKWARRHPRLTSVYAVGGLAVLLTLGLGLVIARQQAVESHRLFAEELRRTRSLLGGPTPSKRELTEGVALGRQALGRSGVMDDSAWARAATLLLPTDQRERLPAESRELLLLLGRGERLLAPPGADPSRDGHIQEAVRLNELAESCPAGEDGFRAVLLQRSLLRSAAGRKGEAEELFGRAEGLPPRTARDFYLDAVGLMDGGDFRTARDHLLRARQLDPQDPFVWYSLGLCLAEMREYPRAAEALTASLALRPDDPAAHYQRARVHNEMKEYAEAVAEFSEAIRLQPDYLDAYIDRAFARTGLKDHEGAEADLTHALEAGMTTTRVYFFRANVRRLTGNEKGAAADEAEGLRREPDDEFDWVARALARRDAGDADGALADLKQALRVNPHCVTALEDRAALLAEQPGHTEDAVKDLDRLLEIAPHDAQARAGRGVLLARLGRRDAALEDAREAERIDPRPAVLYQAAGVYALTSVQHADDCKEAYRLLAAALKGGHGYDLLQEDPDLKPIRSQPEFGRLVEAAATLEAHSPPKR